MSSKVDPPDPVARSGDDVDDNDRPMRWVSVTPATAKRDSSVKLGKVRGDLQLQLLSCSGDVLCLVIGRYVYRLKKLKSPKSHILMACSPSGSIPEEAVSLCPGLLHLVTKGELLVQMSWNI